MTHKLLIQWSAAVYLSEELYAVLLLSFLLQSLSNFLEQAVPLTAMFPDLLITRRVYA